MYMYLLCTCTYCVHVLIVYMYLLCTCTYCVHVLIVYMYLLCTCTYCVHVLIFMLSDESIEPYLSINNKKKERNNNYYQLFHTFTCTSVHICVLSLCTLM